jgi:hypothetical protein
MEDKPEADKPPTPPPFEDSERLDKSVEAMRTYPSPLRRSHRMTQEEAEEVQKIAQDMATAKK